jgi:hypothetical protein
MSQVTVPAVTVSLAANASGSEKNASSPASAGTPSSAPTKARKLRSCVTCRSRKVGCDKQSPCSNCRRANIACVFPSYDRPPKWARRLEHRTNNVAASIAPAPQDADPDIGKVMNRLRNLESLVKELSGQLEQAHAGAGSSAVNSPGRPTQDHDGEHQMDTSSTTNTSSVQKQFGRLVLQDASHSRYVSSGFWSRVNDEVSQHVAA